MCVCVSACVCSSRRLDPLECASDAMCVCSANPSLRHYIVMLILSGMPLCCHACPSSLMRVFVTIYFLLVFQFFGMCDCLSLVAAMRALIYIRFCVCYPLCLCSCLLVCLCVCVCVCVRVAELILQNACLCLLLSECAHALRSGTFNSGVENRRLRMLLMSIEEYKIDVHTSKICHSSNIQLTDCSDCLIEIQHYNPTN